LAKPDLKLRVGTRDPERKTCLSGNETLAYTRTSLWAVHDEIEAATLAKLVICRGCFESVGPYPHSNQAMITRLKVRPRVIAERRHSAELTLRPYQTK
jgi:hypothetical protein